MRNEHLHSLEVNGIKLHWTDQGSGEPVVFINGAIGDYRSWTNQVAEFSKHFRTLALSRRYEYPSKYIQGADGSIDPCIADILLWMQHLNLKKISLVGHSYGGYICLVFAHKYPHLVNKLVLEEPTIFPYITNNPKKPLKLLPLAFKDFGAAFSFLKMSLFGLKPCAAAMAGGDFETARIKFFNAIVQNEILFKEANPILQQQLIDNMPSFQGENNPFIYPFLKQQVKEIKTETLILEGNKSLKWFSYICKQLKKDLPNALLVQFKAPTHWLHLDMADEFNKTVIPFLG